MNLLLFPSILKNKTLGFFSVFIFLILFPNIAFSEIYPTENQNYTCKLESQDCLNDLNNVLLNKEDKRSIYQYCQITSDNFKLCCEDPLNCSESWGKDMAQNLKQNSLSEVQNSGGDFLTCKLNNLSGLLSFLSSTQNQTCEAGVKNCKIECESKLEEVTNAFKKCFFIPENITIEGVLKAVKNIKEPDECLKKMQEVAKKYKEQSLYKKSHLRDKLQSKDIINCETIRRANTRKNLNNFALDVCYQAQEQKEEKIKKERIKKQATLSPEEMKKQEILKRQEIASLEYEKELEEQRKRKEIHLQDAAANSGMRVEDLEKEPKSKQTNKQDLRDKGWNDDLKNLGFGTMNDPDSKKNTTNKTNSNIGALTGASLVAGAIGSNNGKNIPKRNTSLNKVSPSSLKGSNLKTAQAKANSGTCPVNMPEIKSAVVFQSVEAPQIEPLESQEYQKDPDDPSFKRYHTVMEKTAGVFIKLDNFKSSKEAFHLSLNVKGKKVSKCFHTPLNNQTMFEGSDKDCSFSNQDILKDDKYKFIPLPDSVLNRSQKNVPVTVSLNYKAPNAKDYKACEKEKSFKLNVVKVHSLDIGMTAISDLDCKNLNRIINYPKFPPRPNQIVPMVPNKQINPIITLVPKSSIYSFHAPNTDIFQLVRDFINSSEVQYIKSMFPINNLRVNFLEDMNGKEDTLVGNCNNTFFDREKIYSLEILEDILRIEEKRRDQRHHKIIAIVPKDYLRFHLPNSPEVTGVVMPPIFSYPWGRLGQWLSLEPNKWFGGSWNVGLVTEGYDKKDRSGNIYYQSSIDGGIIVHELAHTLGQRKEFYQKEVLNKKTNRWVALPDKDQTQCRKFNGSTEKVCYDYRIQRGLHTGTKNGKNFWQFVEKRWSIMNNEGNFYNNRRNDDDIWIDRETFQKSFKVLSERKGGVATEDENFLDEESREQVKSKVIFSGFYDTKKNKVILSKKIIKKTSLKTASAPKDKSIPTIKFQLKDKKGKVIKEVNQAIFNLEMKLIYKDRPHKKIKTSLSPFLVSFDINENDNNKEFALNVINPKTDELLLAETILIKPKKREEKRQEKNKKKKKGKEKQESDFAYLFDNKN